jgi:hypothetical protein
MNNDPRIKDHQWLKIIDEFAKGILRIRRVSYMCMCGGILVVRGIFSRRRATRRMMSRLRRSGGGS